MRSRTCIQLYSGQLFDPLNPDIDLIDIGDIAHALSLQCRFAGHVQQFYSVAQHSVHVAYHCPNELELTALLHDASEAYLVDLPSPLKTSLFGDSYRDVENSLMTAIALRFGVSWPVPDEVKDADVRMLATEVRDLMAPGDFWSPWLASAEPYADQIKPVPPVVAEVLFLKCFEFYGGKQ